MNQSKYRQAIAMVAGNFSLLAVFAVLFIGGLSANAQIVTHVPLYTFEGDSANDEFGGSVSGAGDVNGDGRADLIVAAAFDDNNGSNSGSVRVLSGSDGSTLYTFDGDGAEDFFGVSVSGAGDVNGDGRADLIVGAPGDDNNGSRSGSARVFSGIDGTTLYTFDGDTAGDNLGVSVSGAEDVNGDGRVDLIVGASRANNISINGVSSGSVRVLSGIDGSTLYTVNGDSNGERFGSSVSGAGDVNGDGRADLIVGALFDSNNGVSSGNARVLSGIDGSTLHTFDGDAAFDEFGGSVSGAGDVDGDGRADLIVGARFDAGPGFNNGSARVLSGSDGSTLYNFEGDGVNFQFGSSVSDAGDVNGDGFADLIVGAVFDRNTGVASGSATVLSGIDGGTLYTFNGDSAGDQFGVSVSGAGDVNGDGLDDFIVGARFGGANGGGYARVFVSQIVGVPEPSSASLLLLTTLAVASRRRRVCQN